MFVTLCITYLTLVKCKIVGYFGKVIDVTLTLSLHSLVKLSKVYIVSTQHMLWRTMKSQFSNFTCRFPNPYNFFPIFIYFLDQRKLLEQVKEAFRYQKLFWPFTVWINCWSDLKFFANSRPSISNFKSFSVSLEQFFLRQVQNNFGNKIPFAPGVGHNIIFTIFREN